MIETKRLILREYNHNDIDSLYQMMSDKETMKYYPAPFTYERCKQWIEWNIDNYKNYGFGLWTVTLKDSGLFIGDCGITMQIIDGQKLPELGFHINNAYTKNGYATEAGRACLDFIFSKTNLDTIYCYQKYTNIPSQKTAEKIGLHFLKKYVDIKNEFSTVYYINKNIYLDNKKA